MLQAVVKYKCMSELFKIKNKQYSKFTALYHVSKYHMAYIAWINMTYIVYTLYSVLFSEV